jgi:predicted adenylyl cyclase CyaB
MQNKEIEIKVKVEHSQKLIDFLEKEGEFMYESSQKDEYFSPKEHSFLRVIPVVQWLRLRTSDKKSEITYKKWYYSDVDKINALYCDEYESKVEKSDQLELILKALNFESIVIVDKVRKVWNFKDYEIALDMVAELGSYVEIEYKNQEENEDFQEEKVEIILQEMKDFLEGILGEKVERDTSGGYPFALLKKKGIDVL